MPFHSPATHRPLTGPGAPAVAPACALRVAAAPLAALPPVLLSLALLLLMAGPASAQVTVGQVDDFEIPGDVESWERGSNVDGALELTADGGGQSGKLVTFNLSQWSGDYLAAGVDSIRVTLANPGSQEQLFVRLALGDALSPGTPSTWFSTLQEVNLLPGQSATVTFSLAGLSLVRVQGSSTYQDVLSDVQALRILHNPEPDARGAPVLGFLRIDDITAIGGTTTDAAPATPSPAAELRPAHPNPFNPSTTVTFTLPAAGPAELVITDLRGRHVRTLASGTLAAGAHRAVWTGQDDRGRPVPSGVYLARLQAAGTVQSQRLSLIK